MTDPREQETRPPFDQWRLTDEGNALRDEFGLSHKAAGLIDAFRVEVLLDHMRDRLIKDGADPLYLIPTNSETRRELAQYLAELESATADARSTR